MATPMESTLPPNRSRANSHSQSAEAQETNSSDVVKVTRQDVEQLNEEQRRELIATIWREIYGPSPTTTSPMGRSTNRISGRK
jgi:hypothetical protein